MAAWYNYTPLGEDDYVNVIGPALQHYQTGKPLEIIEIRLPIFPRIFYFLLLPWKLFGIENVRFLVSWGLFAVGLFSLVGVWAIYRFGQVVIPGQEKSLAWLYAAHYLLPLYGTRTFQESFTLATVPLGLYFLYKKESYPRQFFWGGFILGITAIIRHQAILIPLVFAFFYLWETFAKKLDKKYLFAYLGGGFVSFMLLVMLDVSEGRAPLSTPLAYFRYNFSTNVEKSEYGIYPWYNYLLVMLAVFIPPFSLGLLPAFLRGVVRFKLWGIAVIFFVLIHNLIANKMERFLLPVLPFFFVLTLGGIKDYFYEKFSWRAFWMVNIVLLAPIVFSRSQLNILDAAMYLRHSPHRVVLYQIELWKQGYLGYDRKAPIYIEKDPNHLLEALKAEKEKYYHLLTLGPLKEELLSRLNQEGYPCFLEKTFKPSWQEKLVISVNPGPNRRRDTTYLYLCGMTK